MTTLLELPSKKELRITLFPLGVNNPVLFWPRGVRVGDPRPGVMLRRENDDSVLILEFRAGQNVERPCVRHVDDPYFIDHPRARESSQSGGGAWDYVPGHKYTWYVPAQVRDVELFEGLSLEVAQGIMHMANLGHPPEFIATTFSKKGFNKERIAEFLTYQGTK
jgi:hypothetical protein